jgi:cold-inducible RNA-binding protein
MSTARLYVGNLSYGTTKETLEKAFSAHGVVVSVNLITDRQTGRPKGFAFVEMSTPEEG